MLLEGKTVGVTLVSAKVSKMLIPRALQAFYRQLSYRGHDSNRVYDAMIQATKDSIEYIRARKVCDLLVTMRKSKVATNEVEYGVGIWWNMVLHVGCSAKQNRQQLR